MTTTTTTDLVCRDLEVRYGNVVALHGVTVEIASGKLTTVIGPNGAGKTTLLRTICGLQRPAAGEVVLDGASIGKTTPEAMLGRGVALVPEGRHVFPHLTVADNLALGAFRLRRSKTDVAQAQASVDDVFPFLAESRDRIAGTLSGGEQQMLAIARALMSRPRVLCLDEPSLGLAPKVVKQVLGLLRRLCSEGVAVLLVEQFAYLALRVADTGYLLENGVVVRSGTAEGLLGDELVRSSYLGIRRAG